MTVESRLLGVVSSSLLTGSGRVGELDDEGVTISPVSQNVACFGYLSGFEQSGLRRWSMAS